jgi:hypothetical protein
MAMCVAVCAAEQAGRRCAAPERRHKESRPSFRSDGSKVVLGGRSQASAIAGAEPVPPTPYGGFAGANVIWLTDGSFDDRELTACAWSKSSQIRRQCLPVMLSCRPKLTV